MAVDFQNDLILLTCASGKICSYILPLVSRKWQRLRLVCKSEASRERLAKAYPAAEVLALDLLDRTQCTTALAGVSTCLYIGPSLHRHETQIGYNMVDAAVSVSGERSDGRSSTGPMANVSNGRGEGGGSVANHNSTFKHFVFSSVLNTQLRKLLNHDCKRYVEEYLIESGLNYTILQPAHFMQNFPPLQTLAVQDHPVYHIAFDPEIPFSYLDLQDYAELSVKVFEERERHYHAQYPAVSTAGVQSYDDRLKEISEVIGKQIEVVQAPLNKAVDMTCEKLFGTKDAHFATRDMAERLLLYYDRHGLIGSPVVLELLLGRKPTSLRQWAERNLKDGK